MSEKPKGPEEQKLTPTRSEVVAAHREELGGVAREVEEQERVLLPEEVYSRNLEQTARDVETALEQFDIVALCKDYAYQLRRQRRYLHDYEHTQSFNIDGKKIDIKYRFNRQSDFDPYRRQYLTVTVEGKRYAFKFDIYLEDSELGEFDSFTTTASIRASGKEEEVRSYGQWVDQTYDEDHEKGTINDQERAVLDSARALIRKFGKEEWKISDNYRPN